MSEGLSSEDFAKDLLNPFKDALIKGGITDEFLIKKFKQEFRGILRTRRVDSHG